jgi:hypothetical protein
VALALLDLVCGLTQKGLGPVFCPCPLNPNIGLVLNWVSIYKIIITNYTNTFGVKLD